MVQASKQASKQANIHTHVYNVVTLVWGSLRLAPIITNNSDKPVVGLASGLIYTTQAINPEQNWWNQTKWNWKEPETTPNSRARKELYLEL